MRGCFPCMVCNRSHTRDPKELHKYGLYKLILFNVEYPSTVAARVLGQVGLSPTKNLLQMFSKAACFLVTTALFLSTIIVSIILQIYQRSRWLGLGYAPPKQANNPSAHCFTAVANDRNLLLKGIFFLELDISSPML